MRWLLLRHQTPLISTYLAVTKTAMPKATNQSIYNISSDSHISGRVDGAIEIWKKNRKTLGLFPKGAFTEHAEKGWIIYLLNGSDVVGYLLYRIAKERAVIAHLCVANSHRGTGGARKLFEFFRKEIEDGHCRGIEVKCRGDYDIAPLWPRLGFQYVNTGAGRGEKTTELVKWFFHFDTQDFFYEMMPKPEEDDQVWAVLDANVVFKLAEPDARENQEACALMSETIASYTRYSVTPEIYAEIERQQSIAQKQLSRQCADQFNRLEAKRSEIDHYKTTLAPLWNSLTASRDLSDYMHVVHTAAASIRVFVTQDAELIEKADAIQKSCGVQIIRPVEFISQLDALENQSKYHPSSIARTQYNIRCPHGDESGELAKSFTNVRFGEKQKQLEAKIRSAIASTNDHEVSVITDNNDEHLVLLVEKRIGSNTSIVLLRHNRNGIAQTLLQDLLWKRLGSINQTKYLEVDDPFVVDDTLQLFSQRGFFKTAHGIGRCSIRGTYKRSNMLSIAEPLITQLSPTSEKTDTLVEQLASEKAHRIEEAFWPVKITDADIPTYLVPIQPLWAMHLFDEDLASQQLLGADPNRFFNWENVYYRSHRSVSFKAGDRILWYVSTGSGMKISAIRACSRLIGHEVDTAKALYRKYRRLGIYEWRNLMKMTGGDAYGKLMAMRFYQTECFPASIELEEFSELGIKGAPQSPRRISSSQFNMIYQKGMLLDAQ